VKHVKHAIEVPADTTRDGKDVLMKTTVVFVTTVCVQNVILSTQILVLNVLRMQTIQPLTTPTVSVTTSTSNSSPTTPVHVLLDALSVLLLISITVSPVRPDGSYRTASHGA